MTFEEKIKELPVLPKEEYDDNIWKMREYIRKDKVLVLLPDYDIKPKPDELVESVAEVFSKMHDEINRRMKFHGKYENDHVIMVDKKQAKFVVIPKQKLDELEELLKTRPETIDYPYARKPWCNPEKSAECFELLEKKFRELKEK